MSEFPIQFHIRLGFFSLSHKQNRQKETAHDFYKTFDFGK